MKKLNHLALAVLIVLGPVAVSAKAWGANVVFNGTVGAIEIRTAAGALNLIGGGEVLILQILDTAGNPIRLCDAAAYPTAMALPLSDPAAKSIQATALVAKFNGRTVIGWGLDQSQTQGTFCGIGNFVIY